MRIWRILIAGVVTAIAGSILGGLTCGWLFNWVYQLEPTNVWRGEEAMTGAFFLWLNLGGLILSIFLALGYALFFRGIPGSGVVKGLTYGLIIWLVSTLPGMFATHMFMTVATGVVIYGSILGLVEHLLKGAIIALIYGTPQKQP
ncbi:MAG: hypothetical protein QME81_11515 [bacterium]|nr:hypothetical protein [bacterium]